MRIEALYLRNYRNYSKLDLDLDPNLNLFIGANAQGKTNLLEAISFLATGKSFRTRSEGEMIKWDENNCVVGGIVKSSLGKDKIKIGYQGETKKKEYSVNGVIYQRAHYLGKLIPVLFTPEDLSLVKGPPLLRRSFLDEEISKVSPVFEYELGRYQQIVRQRNYLLKTHRARIINSEELATWNHQLADKAAIIINKRLSTIHKLSLLARLAHRNLTGRDENLDVNYLSSTPLVDSPSVDAIREAILVQINNRKMEEARVGQTLIGPHRDDLVFFINRMNAKIYASQGQQRTLVLALKLAELEFIKGEMGDFPILLLDDVFSELDEKRRKLLVETIDGRVQTFITGTEAEKLGKFKKRGKEILISQGEVI